MIPETSQADTRRAAPRPIETFDRAAGPEYAALRQGGTPAWKARAILQLSAPAAARSERYLKRRGGEYPTFADERAHVRAVLALGGYPVLGRAR